MIMDIYYILLYFFVYGFLGWCSEVGFAAFKEHRFVNRGFLNGPICPIYGVGVTIVIAFLTPYKDNLILLYVSSVILVTPVSYTHLDVYKRQKFSKRALATPAYGGTIQKETSPSQFYQASIRPTRSTFPHKAPPPCRRPSCRPS